MLGALSDFDFEKEKISIDKMTPIDGHMGPSSTL